MNSNPTMLVDRPLPPPLWLIALAIAVSVMGLTLLAPALPLIQKELSASDSAVQQLLTLYMVALAVGQLVCGTVSDRIGRRPVLLTGALMFAVGGAAAVWARDIGILTLCRIVQGLGGAACMAVGRTIINDCFDRSDAARHMSTVSVLIALVPMLSLGVGGVLTETTGWVGIMLLTAAGGLLLFASAWFKLEETHTRRSTEPFQMLSLVTSYTNVLRNHLFTLFAMTSGMQVGMFFSMNGFLPYQYERLGYTPVEFGLWFSLTPLCYLIGNTINGRYLVSRGIEKIALLGSVMSLVSVVSLYTTQAWGLSHALALALPCCLFGLSNGIVVANTMVGAMSAAGRDAGTGTGLVGAWQMAAGGIAGAVIVGLGGAQNFTVGAIGLVIMAVLSFLSMWAICSYSSRLHKVSS